eukprot:3282309-Rhodomonas_salina.1
MAGQRSKGAAQGGGSLRLSTRSHLAAAQQHTDTQIDGQTHRQTRGRRQTETQRQTRERGQHATVTHAHMSTRGHAAIESQQLSTNHTAESSDQNARSDMGQRDQRARSDMGQTERDLVR